MNPITQFFLDQMVAVYFVYGLAFFTLGVVLGLASRRESEFPIVRSLWLLAWFGLLHGGHEWTEMFQKIAAQTVGHVPSPVEEAARTLLLILSFVFLLAFGVYQLASPTQSRLRRSAPFVAILLLWFGSLLVAVLWKRPGPLEVIYFADVLSRYLIAVPGALLAAWALLRQQRSFREAGLPAFGRDLVSAATTLILYGIVGQIFVRPTSLPPSTFFNSSLFLEWFGIPVQLFRAVMATFMLLFIARALRALEEEAHSRLEDATRSRIAAQEQALVAERDAGRETERLNRELQAKAKELALLLDLSNMLGAPLQGLNAMPDRLTQVLEQVVQNFVFTDAALILCVERHSEAITVEAATGFATRDPSVQGARFSPSVALGRQCITAGKAVCRHDDGAVIEFDVHSVLMGKECWSYLSPTETLALPLMAQRTVIGAVVFVRTKKHARPVAVEELHLMVGIARQLELSMENARLYREAQEREETLEQLLYQVVGAQESERQRIARELHDATGQSLTAVALGLRGLANTLAHPSTNSQEVTQLAESIQSFATEAIGELRRIISDLRPPQLDDLGLAAAVRWYVQSFRQRNPTIQTTFTLAGEQTLLPPHYDTVIFRVVQEALTNIARHAQATRASVVLEMKPTEVVVTVQDNGRGFDTAQALSLRGQSSSWGLLGIRERTLLLNGHYEIKSSPGHGTLIRIRVPAHPVLAEAPAEQGNALVPSQAEPILHPAAQ